MLFSYLKSTFQSPAQSQYVQAERHAPTVGRT